MNIRSRIVALAMTFASRRIGAEPDLPQGMSTDPGDAPGLTFTHCNGMRLY